MNKDDALRFKVSISPAFSELHHILDQAGPYYRSRRMLQLALLGLSAEKRHLVTTMPSSTFTQQLSDERPNINQQNNYNIPENASDKIGRMFDSM